MRAAVLEGPRAVRLLDVPDPVLPGPEGVVVTVERTAICGSDLHLYHDAPTGSGIQLGHEAIGTVAEAGTAVRNVKKGDRVLVSGVIGCGVCRACLAGQPNVCLAGQAAAFGTLPGLPGGQAEAMAVRSTVTTTPSGPGSTGSGTFCSLTVRGPSRTAARISAR